MTDFTIHTSKIPGGYSFRRSDGQQFFMINVGNEGNTALYVGDSRTSRQPKQSLSLTIPFRTNLLPLGLEYSITNEGRLLRQAE